MSGLRFEGQVALVTGARVVSMSANVTCQSRCRVRKLRRF